MRTAILVTRSASGKTTLEEGQVIAQRIKFKTLAVAGGPTGSSVELWDSSSGRIKRKYFRDARPAPQETEAPTRKTKKQK